MAPRPVQVPFEDLDLAVARRVGMLSISMARAHGWTEQEISSNLNQPDHGDSNVASVSDMAEQVGVSSRVWQRWCTAGELPLRSAEDVCDRLGWSPYEVWPRWRVFVAKNTQQWARQQRASRMNKRRLERGRYAEPREMVDVATEVA